MSNFEFSDLKDLVDALYNTYYLPSNGKIKLAELLEDVLKLEGKKSPEDAIAALKYKMQNELKNEVSNEMRHKIDKLEQLEKENENLKTKKDKAERLNEALEHANNRVQKEKIELTDKLNVHIQQSQQKKKILEVKNEATEQQREKATYIATASTSLAIGLAMYIALEHTTKLDMWLMISIAVVPALIATGIALKPGTQLNRTQELQGIANESAV